MTRYRSFPPFGYSMILVPKGPMLFRGDLDVRRHQDGNDVAANNRSSISYFSFNERLN